MLPRFLVAVCWAAAAVLAGCGGSSSETPWPLEPDIRFARAQGKQASATPKESDDTSAAGAPNAQPDAPSEHDFPSTWGSSQEPDELAEP
jgi:hypothetical protein